MDNKFEEFIISVGLWGLTVEIVLSQQAITYSKLTIKTLEQGVKYVHNFEHISHLILAYLLLTLNM